MSCVLDFEQAWLGKFSSCLHEAVGAKICELVMAGSQGLSSGSSRQAVIAWSQRAMEQLDSLVDEEKRKAIMTSCACQYPTSDLHAMRKTYEATKDAGLAHQLLQEQFERFINSTLELSEELVGEIVRRGWGLAGVKNGNTIIATKIPKSGNLVAYMKEVDPVKRRQYYCHCPRISDALKISETISPTYCYCGAGFYKGIWEEILQVPVEVEVLSSVLKGDDVCTIAIQLPSEAAKGTLDENGRK